MRILFDRESVCQADDVHDHRCLLDVPDSALVSELLRPLPKKVDLAATGIRCRLSRIPVPPSGKAWA